MELPEGLQPGVPARPYASPDCERGRGGSSAAWPAWGHLQEQLPPAGGHGHLVQEGAELFKEKSDTYVTRFADTGI